MKGYRNLLAYSLVQMFADLNIVTQILRPTTLHNRRSAGESLFASYRHQLPVPVDAKNGLDTEGHSSISDGKPFWSA